MVGDPKECREHAKACVDQANETHDWVWLEMAQKWIQIAGFYEGSKQLLALLLELEKEP